MPAVAQDCPFCAGRGFIYESGHPFLPFDAPPAAAFIAMPKVDPKLDDDDADRVRFTYLAQLVHDGIPPIGGQRESVTIRRCSCTRRRRS